MYRYCSTGISSVSDSWHACCVTLFSASCWISASRRRTLLFLSWLVKRKTVMMAVNMTILPVRIGLYFLYIGFMLVLSSGPSDHYPLIYPLSSGRRLFCLLLPAGIRALPRTALSSSGVLPGLETFLPHLRGICNSLQSLPSFHGMRYGLSFFPSLFPNIFLPALSTTLPI